MNEKTFICCHSPSLALLLYETNKADSNQIGLLLGTVKNEVIKCATDENESSEEEKTVIYVEHCVPLPSKNIFNCYGQINNNLLSSFCQDFQEKVIGWYSFRRNCKHNNCSFRDNLIHRNLLHYFQMGEPENFVLGLISASAQFRRSTHDFNYTFLTLRGNIYEALKFKIYCLSDKPWRSNGYITNSFFPVSQNFCEIERGRLDQSATKTVSEICISASECLSSLSISLMTLEDRKKKLQNEVIELQKKIRLKEKPNVCRTNSVTQDSNDYFLKFDTHIRYSEKDNPISPFLLMQLMKRLSSERQRQENRESTHMAMDCEPMACEAPQKDSSAAPPEHRLQENQTKSAWKGNNSASALFSPKTNLSAGTSSLKGETSKNEPNLPMKNLSDSNNKSSVSIWNSMDAKSAGDGTKND